MVLGCLSNRALVNIVARWKLVFRITLEVSIEVSLGKPYCYIGLRWYEMWPIWVSNFFIKTKWEVTVWLRVDTSSLTTFSILSNHSTLLRLRESISSHIPPSWYFNFCHSWRGTFLSFSSSFPVVFQSIHSLYLSFYPSSLAL